jgi:general secretion pathway protein A
MVLVSTGTRTDHLEKYEPYFGLTEAPFSLAPDPRFLFASESLSAALDQLAYALGRREPLIVVTGEIGTGKTLLCRAVMQRLPRKTFLSMIDDPLLERDDLLKHMLEDFGVIAKDRTRLTETTRHELVETLQAFLRSLVAIHAHAVVAVDEAQHLRPDVLEQIRLLSNINDERGTLLQIVLVGQPELESLLARPELRQLQQRVSRRFRLEPLNRGEVHGYIDHRLALARNGRTPSRAPGATELAHELAEWSGAKPSVEFTPDAVQAVFELSQGLPRVVNLLCDRSLEEARASGLHIVDDSVIHKAAGALGLELIAVPTVPAIEDAPPRVQPRPEHAFWLPARSDSLAQFPSTEPTDSYVPDEIGGRGAPTPARRQLSRYVLLAASLAVAAFFAVWFSLRAASPSPSRPPTAAAPPSTPNRAPDASAAPVSGGTNVSAPKAATAPVTAQPPTAAAAAAPPATATGERFDIVVASFRTDTRAAAVAADIETLRLPVRRRVADGWQQVVVGPFASRTDAEEAQQRLARAGLGGTQIVPGR